MNVWSIGLSPWIIQDENYPDFWRGQIAKFALEFGTYGLTPSSDTIKRAEKIDPILLPRDGTHRVNAAVAYAAEWLEPVWKPAPGTMDGLPMWDEQGKPIFYYPPLVRQYEPRPLCVLDFGVCAYSTHTPAIPDTFVAGTVSLNVDPFFYFEQLYEVPELPPLIYTWRIEGITLFNAPLVEKTDEMGRPRLEHDMERRTADEVERTNARQDHWGWYVMECAQLDVPPAALNREQMQAYYAALQADGMQ